MKARPLILIYWCAALAVASAASRPADSGAGPAGEAPGFTVHEWGTFTTVSGSGGGYLPGLDREEEALPPFVYAHDGMGSFKGFRRPLSNVTVKMETPVLYFYSDAAEPVRASVVVGFEGGAISQWYPGRSGGETPPPLLMVGGECRSGAMDFAEPYRGEVRWDIEVLPRTERDRGLVFKPWESRTWVYPRVAGANVVRTPAGEHEGYLFYRGVGNFRLPAVFRAGADGTLEIENVGAVPLPGGVVFELNGEGEAAVVPFGQVEPEGVLALDRGAFAYDGDWESEAFDSVWEALRSAGLTGDEAAAMVQTWWQSYFPREGLRVFWVVPREFTDAVLPLEVTPAPYDTVRVLLGRAEVLTPEFEGTLAAEESGDPEAWGARSGDRYFPAYVARLGELGKDGAGTKR